MTRLQTLRNRKERLIQANQINHYTQSSNPKTERYFKVLLSVKKQINTIECINVRPAKAVVGMDLKTLFNLNKN